VAVFVAAGLTVSVSLVAAPGARSQEASEPYSQVVDNATEGRFEAPGWETRTATPDSFGTDYSVAEPSAGAEPARFKVNIPETGEYTVFARWPASATHNVSTVFEVSTASGIEPVEVDQQSNGGQWVKLGTYTMEAGDSWAVSVSRVDFFKELVVADAIQVVQGAQEGISGTLGATSSDMLAATRRRGTGRDALRSGRRFIGVPYRFERCSVRDGMDCSCLTKRAFAPWRNLPDDPNRQFRYGRRIPRSHIKPGDLLFFNEKASVPGIDHVGIAAPRGKILHASNWCGDVCQTYRRFIMDDFVGAKRLLPAR
jgi:cell wall-associated NlpC family hydrolase